MTSATVGFKIPKKTLRKLLLVTLPYARLGTDACFSNHSSTPDRRPEEPEFTTLIAGASTSHEPRAHLRADEKLKCALPCSPTFSLPTTHH